MYPPGEKSFTKSELGCNCTLKIRLWISAQPGPGTQEFLLSSPPCVAEINGVCPQEEICSGSV